ncbi:hypothetical protein [Flavobacterium stagni]|uniref:Uncharacterized protein n=1 Tax=Flavobacterium stagni TaxID=2506421 RepID=A0A4Q1KBV9_9FLAO|nr:hypothetical protein [Flavobacterium stagni]RXR24395.1 hypothetical protein EQG61_02825 [Flavobacterium stagni]
MNIIRLFENLQLDHNRTHEFTEDEIIRIEKQVNVEKRLNPDIDVNVASQLTEALRNYPHTFYFVIQERVLYNFFAGTTYGYDRFQTPVEADNWHEIQIFFEKYLLTDLSFFLEQKIADNQFDAVKEIMEYSHFFPEEFLLTLQRKAIQKIEFAVNQLMNPASTSSHIDYCKTSSFFNFLSQLTSPEMDEKVKILLNRVVDIYNSNNQHPQAGSIMVAMASYRPFDEDLEETLLGNRNVVLGKSHSKKSYFSSFSWKTFGIILIILLKIAFAANRCSGSSSSTYEPTNQLETTVEEAPPTTDRYYTDMHFKIDSFKVFLTHFDPAKITQVKPIEKIVTSSNPFTTFYNDQVSSAGDERFQRIQNKTNYDVIVLENVIVYDSIKMPAKAFYIKANESFQLNTSDYNKRILNFYVGRNLASFQDPSRHYFIGNHSNVEYRFTELAPNAKELIDKDCRFEGPIELREEKGKVEVFTKEVRSAVEEIKEAAAKN